MNTVTQHYRAIKDEHAPLHKCFFAFSKQQFEDGKKEAGILEDEKIYSAECGLFGTQEGLQFVFDFYE